MRVPGSQLLLEAVSEQHGNVSERLSQSGEGRCARHVMGCGVREAAPVDALPARVPSQTTAYGVLRPAGIAALVRPCITRYNRANWRENTSGVTPHFCRGAEKDRTPYGGGPWGQGISRTR